MRAGGVDIAVIGGGIAGLAAAHRAVELGASVALLETSDRFGGKMRSTVEQGYLVEHGPHSIRHNAVALWQLIDRARARARVRPASKPGHRYIFRGGRLRRMPSGPQDLVRSDWLSHRGKLRLLAEPFIAAAPDPNESLGAFSRRRLGDEVTDSLLSPFVSGIYAGSIDELAVADAFPSLHAAERDHGSVLRGLAKGRKGPTSTAPGRGIFSFEGGLGALAQAIGESLPDDAASLGTTVKGLQRSAESAQNARKYGLSVADARSSSAVMLEADQVVLALPSGAVRSLLATVDPAVAEAVPVVDCVPIALVHLGGRSPSGVPPQGFGALIGRGEGVHALGILFPSASFPGRAPTADGWQHSVFMGGAHDRAILDRDDAALMDQAQADHRKVLASLGADGLSYDFGRVTRHRAGIPQFRAGHRRKVQGLRDVLAERLPGMHVAGSFFDGISVGDAAESGFRVAETALGQRGAA